ncbi:MAG: tetratricopeptide repeat protein [Nitrospirota bacterium]
MDPKELLGKAQILFVEGNEEESIKVFTQAMDAGADPFIVYLSRGVAHMKLRKPEKAREDFNRAIEASSNNPRPYYYRGMLHMDADEYEEAVSDFSRALALKPDLHFAKFARATANGMLGRVDESSADFKEVIPLMEENIQGFADQYGILRTQMWKVMAQLSGERETATVQLSEQEMGTLKKWLDEDK